MRWEHMNLLPLCRSKQVGRTVVVGLLCVWGWAYEGICLPRTSPADSGLGSLHSDANAACYPVREATSAACRPHDIATMQLAIH